MRRRRSYEGDGTGAERREVRKERPVQDLIFVTIIAAFFALSVLLVRACDRLIGEAEDGAAFEADDIDERQAA